MSEQNRDLEVPPQWVALSDVPRLLERFFGLKGGKLYRKLCLMVRDGHGIKYRIGKPRFVHSWESIPRGLYRHTPSSFGDFHEGWCYFTVTNWEVIEADFTEGTALGDSGRREKLELLWSDVEQWVESLAGQNLGSTTLEQKEAADKEVVEDKPTKQCDGPGATSPAESVDLALPRRRGRKPFKTVDAVDKLIARYQDDPSALKDKLIKVLAQEIGHTDATTRLARLKAMKAIFVKTVK